MGKGKYSGVGRDGGELCGCAMVLSPGESASEPPVGGERV